MKLHTRTKNGDEIVEIRIVDVPVTLEHPEGVRYSFVFIKKGKRILGYDNFGGHTELGQHHKHRKGRIVSYAFVDVWQAIADFVDEVERLRKEP